MKIKNLFQLKNRIAWEIQTMKDRKKRIERTIELAKHTGRHCDPRLADELVAIERRLPQLEELHVARLVARKITRALPHLERLQKQQARNDLAKVGDHVRHLRFALGV